MVCPALCFLPRFGDHAFEMKASDVSEMQPLLVHSSSAAAVPFGFLGPCFQFILVSRANKSHSYCFLSDDLVMLLLSTDSVPGFFFFPFFFNGYYLLGFLHSVFATVNGVFNGWSLILPIRSPL